ncbi:hypothetical protein EDB19DRAFT_1830227 [Suillus lakei]|nr:hypothetical protein EDB19DRAFT_1830227 [Suillus lakei]
MDIVQSCYRAAQSSTESSELCWTLTVKTPKMRKPKSNSKLKKELEKEERRGETHQIVKNAKNFEGKEEEGRKLEGEDQIGKKKREKLTRWSKMRKLLWGRRRRAESQKERIR